MQLLLENIASHEKENAGRGRKPGTGSGYGPTSGGGTTKRAGSVPRASAPTNGYKPGGTHKRSSSNGPGGQTKSIPATRSAPSGSSTSAPAKRQKLGDSTSSSSSSRSSARAPLQSTTHNNHLPSHSHVPSITVTTKAQSTIPRAKPVSVPAPKANSNPAALGHGRPPTSAPTLVAPAAHHYSGSRTSSTTSAATVQAARATRRESFKPRPSMDDRDGWTPGASTNANGGGRKWASVAMGSGVAITVKEEEED
jgi:Ase1/PRC1/MAP65 family protein